MATKTELLRELFIANGLNKEEDTWELPMGNRPTIITRTGIEKIQFHNNIKVTYILTIYLPCHVLLLHVYLTKLQMEVNSDFFFV